MQRADGAGRRQEIRKQTFFPYKRVGICNDHSSSVRHVDFDETSRYIQSVSQANEILYAYVSTAGIKAFL